MKTSKRILVMDDEVDVGKVLASAVEAIGYVCTFTTCKKAFLAELDPEIDLVLLDLMMPGADGIEMLSVLAERKCKAPLVLMSGVGDRILETAEELARSLGLTVLGHLNKPFRMKELRDVIKRATKPALFNDQAKDPIDVHVDELRHALDADEFVLHYQPKVNVLTGRVTGVEALVRWEHPNRGLIFPDQFISRLESLGLIDELGWLVCDRGMREVGKLSEARGEASNLSLNVSVHSLKNLDFPEKFLSLILNHGLSANSITVEVTESGLVEEVSSTLAVLTRLRMSHVQLSIDDFGTGYAMMHQLRNVPATELKIDKSFVQSIGARNTDRIIVEKTVEIGHELGMNVVGEGVESHEQLEFLRSVNCDAAQGFLFCRPLPPDDLRLWLEDWRRFVSIT